MNTMKTKVTPVINSMHSTKTQTSFGFFDLRNGSLVASGTRSVMRDLRADYAEGNSSRYSGVRRITFSVSNSETI